MKRTPLTIILCIVFVDLIGFGMIIPILPLYAGQFGANEWQIGFLLATYSLMQFLASPVLGSLSDRWGRRPILLGSLLGSALGYVVMAEAGALWMLFLARFIDGISGASVGTASAYIADITPPENRSRRLGLIGAAFGVGFVLGPAIGGLLSRVSVSAPFWFAAVLAVLNAIAVLAFLPEPERHAARAGMSIQETFARAGNWQLGVLCITYFIAISGFAIVTMIYPQVSSRRFALNQAQISYIFVLMGLIGASIQGGGIGRLSKRFGDLSLASTGLIVMAVSMALMTTASSISLFLVLTVLLAIGNSLSQPTIMALASKSATADLQGRTLGILQSAGSLGRVVGPAIGGFLLLRDHPGPVLNYGNTPFLAGGFVMACAFILSFALRKSRNAAPTLIKTSASDRSPLA